MNDKNISFSPSHLSASYQLAICYLQQCLQEPYIIVTICIHYPRLDLLASRYCPYRLASRASDTTTGTRPTAIVSGETPVTFAVKAREV